MLGMRLVVQLIEPIIVGQAAAGCLTKSRQEATHPDYETSPILAKPPWWQSAIQDDFWSCLG